MFELKSKDRRIGKIKTKNGEIDTPFFMPDATKAFVRSLDKDDLEKIGMGPMVVNTYHLYLQPGMETIKKFGGVNAFMNWKKPLLSDSGGYQVFSLVHKNSKMGRITDKEVIFRSPIDGSLHKLSPEKAIEIQFDLGVDMMVCLDDVPPHSYSKKKIEEAVRRTISWAKRCKVEYEKQIKERKIEKEKRPLIFGVIQGGMHFDLREMCAKELVEIGFDGYGFGARHVDQNGNFLEEMVRQTAEMIPEKALRFALGVGTPEDIVKFMSYGWDMFDCVIPTREGRHGRLFLRKNLDDLTLSPSPYKGEGGFYETININNEKYKNDFSPVDPKCDCALCQNYTKGYLRHLFMMKEPLGMRLATIHNLKFYMDLMDSLRTGNQRTERRRS